MDTSAQQFTGAQTSVTGIRTRKRRSIQEKLQIVRETLQSEASVAVIARRHGVNANQLFTWRRQYQRGQLKGRSGVRAKAAMVLPVQIAELPQTCAPGSTAETTQPSYSAPRIEIDLANGPRVRSGTSVLRRYGRSFAIWCGHVEHTNRDTDLVGRGRHGYEAWAGRP